jgi:hypothetical protein
LAPPKRPVNVNWQTLFVFLPIVSIWALWRIQKLKRGIGLSILTDILLLVPENVMFLAGHDTTAIILSIISPIISAAMLIYHTRKWSKEWNEKLSHSK